MTTPNYWIAMQSLCFTVLFYFLVCFTASSHTEGVKDIGNIDNFIEGEKNDYALVKQGLLLLAVFSLVFLCLIDRISVMERRKRELDSLPSSTPVAMEAGVTHGGLRYRKPLGG